MGIVSRQAVKNSIFLYAGVILGYVNLILLFPAYFSSEQFGLIQLLISGSVIYSQLSSLGIINTIIRFFPFFKTDDKKHNFFITYVLLISGTGFILVTIIYILLKKNIENAYTANSPLFLDYYYLLILLSFFSLLFVIFEAFTRIILKTVLATFTKEVFLRLLTTTGIILFITKVFDFNQFIIYYIFSTLIGAAIILVQIIKSKNFEFGFHFNKVGFGKIKELLNYGLFNLLSGTAALMGQRTVVMIIGSMLGLSLAGAYSIYFYIASVIYVPMRSLSRITVPIIATSFKENELIQISDLYKRTSLLQFTVGCLIYIGIIINRHNLFSFLKKPEYIDNFIIFYFIGAAILIDAAAGLNSDIISNSKKFKFDALFNIILLVFIFTTNYLFINLYGITGAAIALLISFTSINLIRWYYVFREFNMQPFNIKHIYVVLISFAAFLSGNYIPQSTNIIFDILLRSITSSAVFFSLILFFNVSEDISDKFKSIKNLIFKRP